MARFRATIQGQRGAASRLGSAKSGITATVNGWNAGIRVSACPGNMQGQDVFMVEVTYGSHCRKLPEMLLSVTDTPEGPKVEMFNA